MRFTLITVRLLCQSGNNLIFTWLDKATDNVTGHSCDTWKLSAHMLAMPVEIPSLFILLGSESDFEWLNVVHVQWSVHYRAALEGHSLFMVCLVAELKHIDIFTVYITTCWLKLWLSYVAVAFQWNNNFLKIRQCQPWLLFALCWQVDGIVYSHF